MSPKPGQPVRGSRSGRPIMALLDLLGRRWALRVLWELHRGERLTFRELRVRCDDVSPAVLNARIKELRDAGILTPPEGGCALTAVGQKLLQRLAPLNSWAQGWAAGLSAARPGGKAASRQSRPSPAAPRRTPKP